MSGWWCGERWNWWRLATAPSLHARAFHVRQEVFCISVINVDIGCFMSGRRRSLTFYISHHMQSASGHIDGVDDEDACAVV